MYNRCSIVKSFTMFLSLVKFKHPFNDITELHKIKVSFLSVKTFPYFNEEWIPVLINKIWHYKMHQESQSSYSWAKSNSVFQMPKLTICSKIQVKLFKSCPGSHWSLGDLQLYLKVWECPRDLFFTFILEQNQQTS